MSTLADEQQAIAACVEEEFLRMLTAARGRPTEESAFVRWLRTELDRRRLTQAAFADVLGTSTSAVSTWLHGRRPGRVFLVHLAAWASDGDPAKIPDCLQQLLAECVVPQQQQVRPPRVSARSPRPSVVVLPSVQPSTTEALPGKLLLSVAEAAACLGVSRATLYGLLKEDTLPTVRLGRATKIPIKALEEWIAAHTSGGS